MLEGWDYDPDKISVRIVPGEDGRDKLQLRLDLGLMQMEFDGRPDGKRIEGCASWLEYYQQLQGKHDKRHPDGPPFLLESDDCQRLLREGVQFYHRYISFWHLERFELCARDTNRNLKLLSFVREYARETKDKLQFDQWRPYVTMMHARAVATPLVALRDFRAALGAIDAGIEAIRAFLREYEQPDDGENCGELQFLLRWREEVAGQEENREVDPPYNPIVQLKADLEAAVREERFEDAARLRDTLRQHSDRGPSPGPPNPL